MVASEEVLADEVSVGTLGADDEGGGDCAHTQAGKSGNPATRIFAIIFSMAIPQNASSEV
jgi:hypothetical protein